MPGRRKLKQEIFGADFMAIERQARLLEIAVNNASIGLNQYSAHGEAIARLRKDLLAAVNVLGNRPVDYFRHGGHMAPAELAWHNDVERMGQESLKEDKSSK